MKSIAALLVAAGSGPVLAAAHRLAVEQTVLEEPPVVEVLVVAGSSHFEQEQQQLGSSEPGVASRPSHGQRLHFGCREAQWPKRLGCRDRRYCDDVRA